MQFLIILIFKSFKLENFFLGQEDLEKHYETLGNFTPYVTSFCPLYLIEFSPNFLTFSLIFQSLNKKNERNHFRSPAIFTSLDFLNISTPMSDFLSFLWLIFKFFYCV